MAGNPTPGGRRLAHRPRLGGLSACRRLPHSRWGCRSNTTGALLCLALHPVRSHSPEACRALEHLLGRETREAYAVGFEMARLIGAEPKRAAAIPGRLGHGSKVAGRRSNVRTQSFAIRTRVTLIEAAWLPPRTADIPVGFVLLGAHGGAPLRLDRGLTARLRIHAAHDVGHRLNCIPEPAVHRRPWAGAASGPIPEILPPSKAPRTADRGCEPPADRSPHPPPR